MDHHVVITGSTGGLGSCIAKECIKSNKIAKIHLLYRNPVKFNDLYKDYSDTLNDKIRGLNINNGYCDLFDSILSDQEIGQLTLIITAFTIHPTKKIGDFTLEELENNFKVNIFETVRFLNRIIAISPSKLRIINIDSGAAYKAISGWGLYCSAKAYINMFLQTLQLENPDAQIITYEPGIMDTEMQKTIRETSKEDFTRVEEFRNFKLNGRLRKPEDVACDLYNRFIIDWTAKDFKEGYKSCDM